MPIISNKLYKFYDLSTAQLVETMAVTEQQARQQLGNPFLIFVARKHTCSVTRMAACRGMNHD